MQKQSANVCITSLTGIVQIIRQPDWQSIVIKKGMNPYDIHPQQITIENISEYVLIQLRVDNNLCRIGLPVLIPFNNEIVFAFAYQKCHITLL